MVNELTSGIVKEYGSDAGAAVVGIAASKDFDLAPDGFKPSDNLEKCLSVIVLGVPFPKESLSGTPNEYTDTRNEMCRRMDAISKDVAKHIKADGHKAKAISSIGGKWVNGFSHGHISLKHAAELAGLGVIGKNYLLMSPEHGSLLWFAAVLTDAELDPDKKAEYSLCDDCNKCVDACPSKALGNINAFEKKKCAGTCWKMVDHKWLLVCHTCRKVCPHAFGKTD